MLGRNPVFLGAALLFLPALAGAHDCLPPANNPSQPGIIVDWVKYSGTGFPPRVLSLTYDDGPSRPSASTTLNIAEYLKAQGIRATFFVVPSAHHIPCSCYKIPGDPFSGCNHPYENEQPDLSILPTLVTLGHRVANHTNNHERLDLATTDTRDQVCKAQQAIESRVVDPDGIFLMRPPGGGWDGGPCPSGKTCQSPANVLRSDSAFNRIVGPVLWNLSIKRDPAFTGDTDVYTSDWDCAKLGHTPQDCGDKLLTLLDQNPLLGGTVLLHDWIVTSDPPTCAPYDAGGTWAYNLTQYLVPRLKQRGYLILPLDGDKELPGGVLFERAARWTTNFSDVDGFGSDEGYYGTFRLGDVNGDHLLDVCARAIEGMHCNLSSGTAFTGPYQKWQNVAAHAFRNDNGWLPAYHSTTVQLGDVNGDGKADVCGLGAGGVVCGMSSGTSFGNLAPWLSNAYMPNVYQNAGYYGTLRLADVTGDGRADLCFRLADGVYCAVSETLNGVNHFATPVRWTPRYSDADGWLPAKWSTSIQLGDLDGDGKADLCGRGIGGLYCARSNGTNAFVGDAWWSAGTVPYGNFSEAEGFGNSGYYQTFRLGDLDGDGKADACLRSAAGVLCAKSTGSAFEVYKVWQKADFRDDQGWIPSQYSATFMLGDVTGDGKADLCGRRSDGVVCSPKKP